MNTLPQAGPLPREAEARWTAAAVCALLAALTWAVFGQTLGHEFFNFDDEQSVYGSPQVVGGLHLASLRWAFTHAVLGHWGPLTTLSHLVDCQVYGLHPWGHHLSNVILHGLGAMLLFAALWRMTACRWRSAFAAAVFAIHPLRVESVAWVTERKDVLSGVLFMLILLAYAGYVRKPSAGRYLALLLVFALGLMAKSMLVTVPFVLLLLDFWPLGRFVRDRATVVKLLWEKLPLLALSAGCAVVQVIAARAALAPLAKLPLSVRIENGVYTYAIQLRDFFWPEKLAVLYPHPGQTFPLGQAAGALAVLMLLSLAVWWRAARQPYLAVGWLWYLGMLFPVIGIIQSGEIARADRYTYLPQIGLAVALAWGAGDLLAALRLRPISIALAATVVLGGLSWQAWRQTAYWKTSETLWRRTIECTERNATAHSNLGVYLLGRNDLDAALREFLAALSITPELPETEFSIGAILARKDRPAEAIRHFETGLRHRPGDVAARNKLGLLLAERGQLDEAVGEFRKAIEAEPGNAGVRDNLATALLRQGRLEEALAQDRKAAELSPGNGDFENGIGIVLVRMGQLPEAIVHYRRALALKPGDANTENNLAWLLATAPSEGVRNGPEAVRLAEHASTAAGGSDALLLSTLAAALAETGRFPEAIQTAEQALRLAGNQGDAALGDMLRSAVDGYRLQRAFRDASVSP